MTPERLDLVLAVGALVLLGAAVGVRLAGRLGLPSLLAYLGIGLLLGESVAGIDFSDAELTHTLGLIALALILAEGGLTTRWSMIRPALGFALVLSTVGVFVSVLVVAGAAHVLLGMDWRISVLLGAIVSSTDAAAVFSVLRKLPLRGRLAAALEAESGLNDAPTVILVTLVASDHWAETSLFGALGMIVYELAAGGVIGVGIGRLGRQLLIRSALPSAGLYPLATLALALLAYASAGLAHASGFLAVYLAGLALGNARLPHRRAVLGFAEGIAWLAQIGLFVLLGLLASPGRLPAAILPALVVGTALLVVARPASVVLSALPFRLRRPDVWTPAEQVFLSWAGLRGAVPIVLCTIPLTEGVPEAERLFDLVFLLVVVFTIIQAPTLPAVARRLGMIDVEHAKELDVEVAPLEEMGAELLQVTVPAGSRLAGVYLDELRLPRGAAVTLVARAGRTIVPDRHTRLVPGDHVLVVSTVAVREAAEHRLRAVSRRGRLAGWLGEKGT